MHRGAQEEFDIWDLTGEVLEGPRRGIHQAKVSDLARYRESLQFSVSPEQSFPHRIPQSPFAALLIHNVATDHEPHAYRIEERFYGMKRIFPHVPLN